MAEVKNYHIKIEGMTCAACSAASERALSKTKGVISASVNLALGSAEVTAEAATSPEMLLNAVSAVGYKASFATDEDLSIEETHQFSKAEIIIGLIFGFLVMYIGMSHMLPFPLPLPGIISMEAHPLNFALSQLLSARPCGGAPFFSGRLPSAVQIASEYGFTRRGRHKRRIAVQPVQHLPNRSWKRPRRAQPVLRIRRGGSGARAAGKISGGT